MIQDTNPSVVARETLRQLVIHNYPPTPDNYHKMYEKIAGTPSNRLDTSTMKLLFELATELPRDTPELLCFANTLKQAANDKNWRQYKATVIGLIQSATPRLAGAQIKQRNASLQKEISWSETIAVLLRQLEVNHGVLTTAKKRESLYRVLTKFADCPSQLQSKLLALVDSWAALASAPNQSIETGEFDDPLSVKIEREPASILSTSTQQVISLKENAARGIQDQLQELLVLMLEHIAAMQLGDSALADEAKLLAKQVRVVNTQQEFVLFIASFKQFGDKLESYGENGARLQQGLLRLFNLLMDRTRELLSDDKWLQGQIAQLRETLSSQLDLQVIEQAEQHLTKIMHKQCIIKYSLNETKTTLKRMVTCLVDNIETLSDSTGEYHDKIEQYSAKMNQTEDITELNQLLVEIMAETKKVQTRIQDSRNDFLEARVEVDAAHGKIQQLEYELVQMGEKVLEDHLTGILNRRGLDSAFARESSRAERLQKPLSLAILDIDNFKLLNDTHGHKVGDDVLVYLVKAIQETMRPDDIVTRFGGEEFVILLPDTSSEQAELVVTRVRRNLTKRLFLHENKRLLITFSAGVAQWRSGELQENVVVRADDALYRAKKNGKNQVVVA
jgi:diguanylate cyclase